MFQIVTALICLVFLVSILRNASWDPVKMLENYEKKLQVKRPARVSPPSKIKGTARALLITIKYNGEPERLLPGPICDGLASYRFLTEFFGFSPDDITWMHDGDELDDELITRRANMIMEDAGYTGDSNKQRMHFENAYADAIRPTGENIKREIQNIISSTESGDTIWLFYSGHGVESIHGIAAAGERTHYEGDIIDQTFFNREFADKLPHGAEAFVMFDCCYSGAILKLPYIQPRDYMGLRRQNMDPYPLQTAYSREHDKDDDTSPGKIIYLSGCTETQMSSGFRNGGTLTTTFWNVVHKSRKRKLSLVQIISDVRWEMYLTQQKTAAAGSMPEEQYAQLTANYQHAGPKEFVRDMRNAGTGSKLSPLAKIRKQRAGS